MRFILGLAASLFLGIPGAASQPSAPKLYVLTFENTKSVVDAGKRGVLELQIRPVDGYKVNREAPLSVDVESAQLKFAKTRLGLKDTRDAKSPSLEFKVGFEAGGEAGEALIRVRAAFFVCDDKVCVRQEAHAETKIRVDAP